MNNEDFDNSEPEDNSYVENTPLTKEGLDELEKSIRIKRYKTK